MPYFFLPPDKINFPPGHFADLDGLLAQGGDLSTEWLLAGYKNGVYLWSSPMEPLKWYCPDPRIVIFPDQIEKSNNIQENRNQIEFNADISSVLEFCESVENKKDMNPSWVTGQFKKVFTALDQNDFVLSASFKFGEHIKTAAFGVRIGNVFFMEYVTGENEKDREIILTLFSNYLFENGVLMIDIHKETNLTKDLGFSEISRNEYLDLLKKWT